MIKTTNASPISRRDRDEVSKIKRMLADHHARSVVECIGIGEQIHHHLERKQLPRGEVQKYAQMFFQHDAEYLRRFVRLFVYQDHLTEARNWERATGWKNLYTHEPQRSNNLLSSFWKSQRANATDSGTKRKVITEPGGGMWLDILIGDCRTLLHGLPDESIQCCITSPPYHFSRDFGGGPLGIGHEQTVSEYIATLVQDVFRPVRRILKDDGIMWVNIGDRMSSAAKDRSHTSWARFERPAKTEDDVPTGNLLRIPDRLAAGLVNDGWIFRSEVIWEKTQFTQRSSRTPAVQHEKVLMFSKSTAYRYFADAVQEPTVQSTSLSAAERRQGRQPKLKATRDVGSVWRFTASSVSGGLAPFPMALAERMMLLSTKTGDRVLDPFSGTGTVGLVAKTLRRRCTLIELNPTFAENARDHIAAAESDRFDEAAD
jgi:site-specific DNA-methyltransferase (cytosine-N4-specific)